MPHGLHRVAAAAERDGHGVRVLDLCFSRRPAREIKEAIGDFQPGLVGVSIRNLDNAAGYGTRFFLPEIAAEIIEPLKQSFGGPVVLGGSAVSVSPERMLEYFDLALAIVGDGEEALPELARRLDQGESFDDLPGLVRRQGGRTVVSNRPARVAELDRLALLAGQRLAQWPRYLARGAPLAVQTKRGCSLGCVYCTYRLIEGSHYRLRDPGKVADEIEQLINQTGCSRVELVDSTFNLPLGHAKQVLRAIINRGLDLELSAMGINPGAVDAELVELMQKAGFNDLSLGVESADDKVLAGLGKNFTTAQVIQAGGLLRSRKMPVTWYLLAGGPGETPETWRGTLQTIGRLAAPWDLVVIGLGIRAYAGAPLSLSMQEDDPTVTSDDFLHPVSYHPDGQDLAVFNDLAREATLRHPNFLIYGQDLDYPAWLNRPLHALWSALAPGQPYWRLFILVRKFERWLGISALRRIAFRRSRRRDLAPATD